jgi:hypothetical protein
VVAQVSVGEAVRQQAEEAVKVRPIARRHEVAEKSQNWRLILEAAQALTAPGQPPFTRLNVYEWIWRRYPRD